MSKEIYEEIVQYFRDKSTRFDIDFECSDYFNLGILDRNYPDMSLSLSVYSDRHVEINDFGYFYLDSLSSVHNELGSIGIKVILPNE